MIARDIVAGQPSYKLLYTTPESLRLPALRDALMSAASNGTLMSFAIDEVRSSIPIALMHALGSRTRAHYQGLPASLLFHSSLHGEGKQDLAGRKTTNAVVSVSLGHARVG